MTKPRYGQLYLALGVISLVGIASHYVLSGPMVLKIVDVVFSFALFATLVGWMHVNQRALTRRAASRSRVRRADRDDHRCPLISS